MRPRSLRRSFPKRLHQGVRSGPPENQNHDVIPEASLALIDLLRALGRRQPLDFVEIAGEHWFGEFSGWTIAIHQMSEPSRPSKIRVRFRKDIENVLL